MKTDPRRVAQVDDIHARLIVASDQSTADHLGEFGSQGTQQHGGFDPEVGDRVAGGKQRAADRLAGGSHRVRLAVQRRRVCEDGESLLVDGDFQLIAIGGDHQSIGGGMSAGELQAQVGQCQAANADSSQFQARDPQFPADLINGGTCHSRQQHRSRLGTIGHRQRKVIHDQLVDRQSRLGARLPADDLGQLLVGHRRQLQPAGHDVLLAQDHEGLPSRHAGRRYG